MTDGLSHAVLRGLRSNAYAGTSDVLVIEADEYDNTFHALQPLIADALRELKRAA